MRELYPPIEPFNTGFLDVGDGHEVYYEQSGNPEGEPALFLHGGPGGGCGIHTRQFFDPAFYMIVTFDQRGCNRSKPNASEDWAGALVGQDTMTLVEDCEKLRRHLEVESWFVVLGGSWGSTLGIIYSQTHQNAMRHLVLRGVFLFTPPEVDYLFQSGEASAGDNKSHRENPPIIASPLTALSPVKEIMSTPKSPPRALMAKLQTPKELSIQEQTWRQRQTQDYAC